MAASRRPPAASCHLRRIVRTLQCPRTHIPTHLSESITPQAMGMSPPGAPLIRALNLEAFFAATAAQGFSKLAGISVTAVEFAAAAQPPVAKPEKQQRQHPKSFPRQQEHAQDRDPGLSRQFRR